MDELKEWMQNAFNKAYLGLLKQGRPSMAENGCAYISPDGCRCAVGFLLPDDWDSELSEDIENLSISYFFNHSAFPRGALTLEALRVPKTQRVGSSRAEYFLKRLQQAHDHPALEGCSIEEWLELWQNKMESIAIEFKLTVPNEQVQT